MVDRKVVLPRDRGPVRYSFVPIGLVISPENYMSDPTPNPPSGLPRTILVLEDNPNRLEAMQTALVSLPVPLTIRHWDSAWTMRQEAAASFSETCLISLDYDLRDARVTGQKTGNGMDAVRFLCQQKPFCPVIVHTSLSDEARLMAETLKQAGWRVRQIPLNSQERIEEWRQTVEDWVFGSTKPGSV